MLLYLNENELFEKNGNEFSSIFKKVQIYNNNYSKYLLEGKHASDILFSINERKPLQEMGQLMAYHMLLEELNSNVYASDLLEFNFLQKGKDLVKDIKSKSLEVWNKVKQWSTEQWDLVAQKIGGKFATAWKFIKKLCNNSIKTVKDFINNLISILQSLGDTIRIACLKLGFFGDNILSNEEAEKIDKQILNESETSNSILLQDLKKEYTGKGELSFIIALAEYVNMNKGNKQLLGEGLDYMFSNNAINEDVDSPNFWKLWLAKHKVLGVICGIQKPNGEKLAWWLNLGISLIGSVLVTLSSMFIAPFGTGLAFCVLVVSIVWSARSVFGLFVKRKSQIKPGQSFWCKENGKIDILFTISFLITIGASLFTIYHAISGFCNMGNVVPLDEAHQQALKEFNEQNPPITDKEEIIKFFKDRNIDVTSDDAFNLNKLADATPGTTITPTMGDGEMSAIQDSVKDGMKGMSASGNTAGYIGKTWCLILKSKIDTIASTWPAGYDYATADIYFKGGLKAFLKTPEGIEWFKKFGEGMEYIPVQSTVGSENTYSFVIAWEHGKMPDGAIDSLTSALRKVSPKGIGRAYELISKAAENIPGDPEKWGIEVINKIVDKLFITAAPSLDLTSRDHTWIVSAPGNENEEADNTNYWLITDVKKEKLADVSKDTNKVPEEIDDKLDKDNDNIDGQDKTNESALFEEDKENDKVDDKNQEVIVWYALKLKDTTFRKLSDKKFKDTQKFIDLQLNGRKVKDVQQRYLYINPADMTIYTYPNNKLFYMKGCFNSLTVKPLYNRDKETAQFVNNMLSQTFNAGILAYKEQHKDDFVYDKNTKKYSLKSGVSGSTTTESNITLDEICKVLNKEIKSTDLFNTQLGMEITKNPDGSISKVHKTIDADDPNFFELAVLPVISDKNSEVYSNILNYAKDKKHKRFKELFFDDNENLNIDLIKKLKSLLTQSASTFDKQVYFNQWEKLFNKSKKIEGVELKNTDMAVIGSLAFIIWKFSYKLPKDGEGNVVIDDTDKKDVKKTDVAPIIAGPDKNDDKKEEDKKKEEQDIETLDDKKDKEDSNDKQDKKDDKKSDNIVKNEKSKSKWQQYKDKWYKVYLRMFSNEKHTNEAEETKNKTIFKRYNEYYKKAFKNDVGLNEYEKFVISPLTIFTILTAIKTGNKKISSTKDWFNSKKIKNYALKLNTIDNTEDYSKKDKKWFEETTIKLKCFYNAIINTTSLKSKKDVLQRINEEFNF